MTRRLFKAVRLDGTDFFSGTVAWLPPDGIIPPEGWLVKHPTATHLGDYAQAYLSVATVATDCTAMEWPCRLLAVEPAGRAVRRCDDLPNKRRSLAWRVVAELPAHLALGPQGAEVAAIIDRAKRLTGAEAIALAAAGRTARAAAWDAMRTARHAAWDAARRAAWEAARDAVWDAARGAAWATLARDLITPEQHDRLMAPWREAVGR